ncbi:HD domain-containing protein [Flavobacterium zepuense]|uniref:HD domain-containing protein n=1 Tax=Flavobacterium zepuense TaxID=2593302 RepID=UPI001C8F936D|nr:HD domain-containing protein [Flavobacterium zepuense]
MIKTKLTTDDLNFFAEESKNYLNKLNTPVSEETITTSDRDIYSKDYSRILYSSSFRRLQGKMQFLSIDTNKFYRNRLTHSQEVVQIARTIAGLIRKEARSNKIEEFKLYGSDMYVIESSCLAHDIGNPPFGHAGERVPRTNERKGRL